MFHKALLWLSTLWPWNIYCYSRVVNVLEPQLTLLHVIGGHGSYFVQMYNAWFIQHQAQQTWMNPYPVGYGLQCFGYSFFHLLQTKYTIRYGSVICIKFWFWIGSSKTSCMTSMFIDIASNLVVIEARGCQESDQINAKCYHLYSTWLWWRFLGKQDTYITMLGPTMPFMDDKTQYVWCPPLQW